MLTVDGWDEHVDEDGDIFYHDPITDTSTYEHPCDAYYRWMYTALKRQSVVRTFVSPSMFGLFGL